jgi:hypothetical protein
MTTTDPYNYHVILKDEIHDKEAARTLAVVGFHLPPQGGDMWEDEFRAITEAMLTAGCDVRPITPESAHSPTGRWFWREPSVEIFSKHIVVTQTGGLDC